MGVAALKIEGRLRGPDYVHHTVTAYRHMLDSEPDAESEALSNARRILGKSLGRKWSSGFAAQSDFADVIQHSTLGVSGLLCGHVRRKARGGFEMKVSRSIAVGDRLRVQSPAGEEGPGFVVTRLSLGRKPVRRSRKGQTCFVHCDKDVAADGMVFKTGETMPDLSARIAGLSACAAVIDLDITVRRSGLSVRVHALADAPPDGGIAERWDCRETFAEAETTPLSADVVEDEFRRSGDGPLMAGNVRVEVEEGLFVPSSRLKALRRTFWTWAETAVTVPQMRRGVRDVVRLLGTRIDTSLPADASAPGTTVRVRHGGNNPVQGSVTCRSLTDPSPDVDELVLPDFCSELDLAAVRTRIAQAVERGIRRFRATSIYGIGLLSEFPGLTVTASLPLPVTNGLALAELIGLGVRRATAWVELDRDALAALASAGGSRVELFTYGRLPLLSTRAEVPVHGEVQNDRGSRFLIQREDDQLTKLFPGSVLKIPRFLDISTYIDISQADLDEPRYASFNFDRDFV